MIPQPKPFLSFDDWLAAERASLDRRTEYVNGEVFAMTCASEAHNLIVANSSANWAISSRDGPASSTRAT
jgi:Uma2 family endonuclease